MKMNSKKINHKRITITKTNLSKLFTQYFLTINHELQLIVPKIIHFSRKKNKSKKTIQVINQIIQKTKITKAKINNDSLQINKTLIGILINQILFINQIFSNHIHEANKHDK